MCKKISLLIAGLIICQTLSTVSAQQKFATVFYDPVGSMLGYSVTRTLDNNFVIAGEKDTRALAMKIDPSGTVLWKKSLGNPQGVFYTLTPTRDGGVVLAGKITNTSTSNTDIFCAKLDAAGDTAWTRSIDMGFDDEALSVRQTLDDGFILSGDAATGGMLVVKLDAAGNLTWGKLYSAGNYINMAFGIDQAADSSYVVSGVYGNQPAFTSDMFLMKLSPSGTVTWAEKEALSGIHYFTGFDVKIIGGEILSLYVTQDSGWVVSKLDLDGNKLWSKYYTAFTVGLTPGYTPKLHATSDGGLVFDYSAFHGPGTIIKIDAGGNFLWSQMLDMSATDVEEMNGGGFIIIGNGPLFGVNSNQTLNPQLGVIGTDALGNGSSCTFPSAITSGNYTVVVPVVTVTATAAGTVSQVPTPFADVTLTIESGCVYRTGGIFEKSQDAVSFRVYPNPSDGVFTVTETGKVKHDIRRVEVFNMLGDQVFVSSDKQDLSLPVDIGQVPAGVYTVKVTSGSGSGTQEIVICH